MKLKPTMNEVITTPKISFVVADETMNERPYRVIIENDDVTAMDFVVMVLTGIFALSLDTAVQVMLTAHQHGEALVTVLPYQDATERVYEAHALARSNGYPLRFYLEPDGSA